VKHKTQNYINAVLKWKGKVLELYPFLNWEEKQDSVEIFGSFNAKINKKTIEWYQISIHVPETFPNDLPIVKEIEGKIPKIPNRHFNPDKSACLFLPDEKWKHICEDSTIVYFLENIVNKFFVCQKYFELTGKWLYGERSHGDKGKKEFYMEELGIIDKNLVPKALEYLKQKTIKGHWKCLCGSNKKLRQCHFKNYIEAKKNIPDTIIFEASKKIHSL